MVDDVRLAGNAHYTTGLPPFEVQFFFILICYFRIDLPDFSIDKLLNITTSQCKKAITFTLYPSYKHHSKMVIKVHYLSITTLTNQTSNCYQCFQRTFLIRLLELSVHAILFHHIQCSTV